MVIRKLLGFRYSIMEVYPDDGGLDGYRFIVAVDEEEAAKEIKYVLEKHDYNFTVYTILKEPVYGVGSFVEELPDSWDANGSPV